MDVMIAGGGTGGHLFPGLALAQELRRRDSACRVLFVGTSRGIETRAVPRAGFDLALLPVSGLRRKSFLGLVAGLVRLPWALVRAASLVRRFRPQLAVSVGGYAAGPAVLAARLLRVPCVVMEQNAVPGLTNRILGRLARLVIAALPVQGFARDKVRVLGNPVRKELVAVREAPYAPTQPLRVLVFGGSQGARALNDVMIALAPRLTTLATAPHIVHQTGAQDFERVQQAYASAGVDGIEVVAFIDAMAEAYRDADLVLCRAGATTVAELTTCGRPAILVPYPFAVDDHQSANAQTLADEGAALHIPERDFTSERLLHELSHLAANPERLVTMATRARALGRPHAAADIVDALEAEVRRV
ncbi:MAG: undecaprenyldiphospho-muramoylpentapeptide beta-N-acetylglucosaminyltransferase [Myxococcota bacterium]